MYDLYSNFDMNKHKETFFHYLEVIVFPDGHVEYAVPSHQEKLIAVCREQLRVSRDELFDMCPEEYYCDVIVWLCNISGCVSVWTNGIMKSDCNPLTNAQWNTLQKMKEIGIYEGHL